MCDGLYSLMVWMSQAQVNKQAHLHNLNEASEFLNDVKVVKQETRQMFL